MFNFEKLEVWQKAIGSANNVYRITKAFPSEERFGLTNQVRRSAVSISSNIAAGTSRTSRIDYARFVEIAAGSLSEAVSQAFLSKRLLLLAEADFQFIYSTADDQSRMLSGFRA